MNTKNIIKSVVILVIGVGMALPLCADAADYNFIISNYNLVKQSLSKAQIQSFLRGQGSCLANYSYGGHSAAWLIRHYSRVYDINPQVVLATLQKEQSLITSGSCSASGLKWAMGWGDRSNFGDQIKYGTRQFRRYLEYPNNYNFKKGEKDLVDGNTWVTPVNQATAGQYNYTPHLHGTQLFKRIYNNWFAANLPTGMYIKKSGANRYYQVMPGSKIRPIKGYEVAASYTDPRNIVELSSAQLAAYTLTGQNWIPFPDGVPILASWGTFYVIEGGQRHGVPSPDVRNRMGYHTNNAMRVHSGLVVQHPEGYSFNNNRLYVNGTLLRAEGESGVWYINETTKKRYAFWSPSLRDMYSVSHTVITVPRSTINKYKYIASNPVRYNPGTLVGNKYTGGVYFIDYDKKKRPIPSRETLDSLGFNMDAVRWEHPDVLNLHTTGSAL